MLNSFRNGVCAFAAAASFLFATGAQAEEHVVLIVDGAYFPPLVYVSAGDSLVFLNHSAATAEVIGAEEAWTSGPIGVDASFTLPITEEMPATFSSPAVDDTTFEGAITFDAPPVEG